MDIKNKNLVNSNNIIEPNYDCVSKDIYFEIYISHKKEVCIIGRFDNNYLCWCSISNIDNFEENAHIFDYVANNKLTLVSQEHDVLGNEKYAEIKNWYYCSIVRTSITDMKWKTPFGCYYGMDEENHGKYFSRDIINFYNELLDLCRFRISSNKYKSMLSDYLQLLKGDSDHAYYNKMKPLISILRQERYLCLCDDEEVRELYLSCMNEGSALYNRYMNKVR